VKFYVLVVVPWNVVDAGDAALRASIVERMSVFGQAHCEAQGRSHHWDYCWSCDKTWLREQGIDISVYPAASATHEVLVFPIDSLTEAGVTAVLLTPEGEWHESAASVRQTDPHWPARALQLSARYAGYWAVLVYAHR
jgi:hypothetical protein